MYGWIGKRLIINLGDQRARVEMIPEKRLHQFIGGRGLNSRALYDYQRPGLDPLGPDNPLIFGVGPVNGTLIPGAGRFTVTAFSPSTVVGEDSPCFGDSNAGGFWGPELKYAGFDQLIIEGASEKPTYLSIRDQQVDFLDASHLWGRSTRETEAEIRRQLQDPLAQVACIGPAGENLVRFACIISSHNSANGKCGIGAVMGSKKLKAIALRGTGGVRVASKERVKEAMREAMAVLRNDPASQVWARYGTSSLLRLYHSSGRVTTRNYQDSLFENWESLSGETFERHFWTGSKACFCCPLHCKHFFRVPSGSYAGSAGVGPEFASTGSFGTKIGASDPAFVLGAHLLCNDLGLDVINVGSTIAWAMECWQRGVMNLSETRGTSLDWGNQEAVIDLLKRIAYRADDFADLLAQGAYRAAKIWGRGSERWVVHAKGQDPALSDARAAKAWGLSYATASRGGCHLRAMPTGELYFTPEQARLMFGTEEAVEPRGVKGKGRLVKWSEDERAVADSLETCKFVVRTSLMFPEWEARFLNSVTGLEFSAEDVMRAGERITNVERAINVRQGLTRKDDTLCDRFLLDPLPSGPAKGEVLDLQPMLDEYYQAREWNLVTGYPSAAKLEALDLTDVAADLASNGKLATDPPGAAG